MEFKILVADDDTDITDTMARKLTIEGYQVRKAYDGDAAWDCIVAEYPDVILLDINMPGKDGFTILKDLRTNPPGGKWIPVIIISGRNEFDDFKQGIQFEADHYLSKPCAMIDVLKAIRLMLQLRTQRLSVPE